MREMQTVTHMDIMNYGYPEGTAYAILIMNGVVPLIDRYIRAKKFGGVSKNGK